jgi:hypothetical protein
MREGRDMRAAFSALPQCWVARLNAETQCCGDALVDPSEIRVCEA